MSFSHRVKYSDDSLSVYAKHRGEGNAIQNADIIKTLPLRDDKKF